MGYLDGSDEFVDQMISLGCRFAWNFTYVPVGRNAQTDLLATAEQREYMYHRVREIRNAAGDVEPCAFIHYSDANIHDVTLETLFPAGPEAIVP